jgi:hypothetical protein
MPCRSSFDHICPFFSDQLPNGGGLAHQEGGSADEREPVRAHPDPKEATPTPPSVWSDLYETLQVSEL